MRLSEQLCQNSEVSQTTDASIMSTAKVVIEIVKSVNVQSAPVPPLNRAQAVPTGKPVPRVGPAL